MKTIKVMIERIDETNKTNDSYGQIKFKYNGKIYIGDFIKHFDEIVAINNIHDLKSNCIDLFLVNKGCYNRSMTTTKRINKMVNVYNKKYKTIREMEKKEELNIVKLNYKGCEYV